MEVIRRKKLQELSPKGYINKRLPYPQLWQHQEKEIERLIESEDQRVAVRLSVLVKTYTITLKSQHHDNSNVSWIMRTPMNMTNRMKKSPWGFTSTKKKKKKKNYGKASKGGSRRGAFPWERECQLIVWGWGWKVIPENSILVILCRLNKLYLQMYVCIQIHMCIKKQWAKKSWIWKRTEYVLGGI